MSQSQNNITALLISDPNGGQPQMFKVLSGTKLPLQLATQATTSNHTGVKALIKNSQGGEQGTTIIQTNKFTNRQIITLPIKQNLNVQGLRGPLVVPVNNVQLKPANQGQTEQLPTTAIITSRPPSTDISSSLVIRTQSGTLAAAPSISTSYPNAIVHPQMSKVGNILTSTTPIIQAQLKPVASLSRPQTFTLKPHTVQIQKQPEGIITLQKPDGNVLHLLKQEHQTQLQLKPQPKPQVEQRHPYQTTQSPGITPPKSLINTSILDHSGSRKRHDFDFDYSVESKRRKTEKVGKGLRHFSMKVCEKVKAKGTTSYNEVADELVNEFTDVNRTNSPSEVVNYDQKNIRRRVYDALNVLMAMNIISKEKKEIRWLGLPTNSAQECHKLEYDRKKSLQRIKLKNQQLHDLILQQIAFKNLVERNKTMEKERGAPSPNSTIQLPFIIVNTDKKTVIDCSISNDKTEYLFNFDNPFEIHDDIEVLKRMGMALGLEKGVCTPEDLEKAKGLLPKALEGYVAELANGGGGDEPSAAQGAKAPNHEELRHLDAIEGEDFEVSLSNLYPGNITLAEDDGEDIARGPRPVSASPSSYGDDYEGFEESDVEIA